VAGDTLSGIARKLGVSVIDLLSANALTGNSVIRPGDTLQIPCGGTPPTNPTTTAPGTTAPPGTTAAPGTNPPATNTPATNDGAVASTEGHLLVGAWVLSDAAQPDAPQSLAVYTSDGIYQQTDYDGASGYGAWESTGPTSAAMTFMQLFPDENGDVGRSATVRATIEVNADGQSFTADYTVELGGGVPAGEFGPGAVTATRIAVEPMGTPVGSLDQLFPGSDQSTDASPPTSS
jgi:hypothetical protein